MATNTYTLENTGRFQKGHGLIDITGQRFGRLTAVRYYDYTNNNGSRWLFRCDCGRDVVAYSSLVRQGRTKSCGCLNQELRKGRARHGMVGTPVYNAWLHMRQRCNNQACPEYRNYGARGISVCPEWDDFSAFYDWSMQNGYRKGLTIDRIDNDGNYSPDNCRWATMLTQENNKRNNHFVTYRGQRMTVSQCARAAGVSRNSLNYRLGRGMTADEAVDSILQGA